MTPNQLEDPDRILYPLARDGERGSGKWRQVSWEEALEDIGGRIRKAIVENRRHEIMYHVGRPGEDGFANRVLQAWGVDGHNSHTNVCSSSARLGHFLWCGNDRPSPDYANAETILLLSSHLETGHYFNPPRSAIHPGQANGGTLIVIDPRLSNTSAKANMWLPAYSGTEGALLLAMVKVLLDEDLYDGEFVRAWVDWRGYLVAERPDLAVTFDNFIVSLKELYAQFTPQFAADETGVDARVSGGAGVGRARGQFSAQLWRCGGGQSGAGRSRCLHCSWCSRDHATKAASGPSLEQVRPEASGPPGPPTYYRLLFPRCAHS